MARHTARHTCLHGTTWGCVVPCKQVCRAVCRAMHFLWCRAVYAVPCMSCDGGQLIARHAWHDTHMTTSLTKWSAHRTTCMARHSYDNIIDKMVGSSHDMHGTT